MLVLAHPSLLQLLLHQVDLPRQAIIDTHRNSSRPWYVRLYEPWLVTCRLNCIREDCHGLEASILGKCRLVTRWLKPCCASLIIFCFFFDLEEGIELEGLAMQLIGKGSPIVAKRIPTQGQTTAVVE